MNAFHLQAEPLVGGGFRSGFDKSAGADDSMPWQNVSVFAEHLRHLAMITGIAGGFGYLSVGGYFAFRDAQDG